MENDYFINELDKILFARGTFKEKMKFDGLALARENVKPYNTKRVM